MSIFDRLSDTGDEIPAKSASELTEELHRLEKEINDGGSQFLVVKGEIEILNKKKEQIGTLPADEESHLINRVRMAREIAETIRVNRRQMLDISRQRKAKYPELGDYYEQTYPIIPTSGKGIHSGKGTQVLSQEELDTLLRNVFGEEKNNGND